MIDSIIVDIRNNYGFITNNVTAVQGGWLNKKWKISTDKGDLLVKQFSKNRYNRDKLVKVETALQRQIILEQYGVLCPYIHQRKNKVIRLLENDIAYMVMDFKEGIIEGPNTITNKQMYNLGDTCGQMKKVFKRLSVNDVEGFPIDNEHLINLLWNNYNKCINEDLVNVPNEYRETVHLQECILKQLNSDFFKGLPKGISHEDFSPDNMLFKEDGVSAILDFDRNHYSYIYHDIGRAILSLTLNNDRLDIDKINEFIRGYSNHLEITMSNVIDALKLTWCIEVPWWIQLNYFGVYKSKIVRFKEEMIWLTKNWIDLESLLTL